MTKGKWIRTSKKQPIAGKWVLIYMYPWGVPHIGCKPYDDSPWCDSYMNKFPEIPKYWMDLPELPE